MPGCLSGKTPSSPACVMLCKSGPEENNIWKYFILRSDFLDRKSTRLNSSHLVISYAVFCLKKKKKTYLSSCLPFSHRVSKSPAYFIEPSSGAASHQPPRLSTVSATLTLQHRYLSIRPHVCR